MHYSTVIRIQTCWNTVVRRECNQFGARVKVVEYSTRWELVAYKVGRGLKQFDSLLTIDRSHQVFFGIPYFLLQVSSIMDNNVVTGQSQSGLWFGKTDDLWKFGKPQGWGAVFRRDVVTDGQVSEPFLMTGMLYH